jgi:hypothetical protein
MAISARTRTHRRQIERRRHNDAHRIHARDGACGVSAARVALCRVIAAGVRLLPFTPSSLRAQRHASVKF